ncbi:hypothetical protein NMG60_11025041 [Bertholletia excelsa]
MGIMREKPDLKSQLVAEICSISKRATACRHRPPLIDWFLVLAVDENAGLEAIKKQYHKLALQVHPDKNKHPRAEIAFKLVQEAYVCLSDNGRRAEFNLERGRSTCGKCAIAAQNPTRHPSPRARQVAGGLFDLGARFSEEVRVIESCLRAISSAKRKETPVFSPKGRTPLVKEHPVFNPGDYLSYGYPHRRKVFHSDHSQGFQYLETDYNVSCRRRRDCGSRIFGFRKHDGSTGSDFLVFQDQLGSNT